MPSSKLRLRVDFLLRLRGSEPNRSERDFKDLGSEDLRLSTSPSLDLARTGFVSIEKLKTNEISDLNTSHGDICGCERTKLNFISFVFGKSLAFLWNMQIWNYTKNTFSSTAIFSTFTKNSNMPISSATKHPMMRTRKTPPVSLMPRSS